MKYRVGLVIGALIIASTADAKNKFRQHTLTKNECAEAKAQVAAVGGPEQASALARAYGIPDKDIAIARAKYRKCS